MGHGVSGALGESVSGQWGFIMWMAGQEWMGKRCIVGCGSRNKGKRIILLDIHKKILLVAELEINLYNVCNRERGRL